ncbi:MAG TPA: TonB-dependent receptor [Candidatus Cybelea sp.]|jgi:hypothetical protein|nr:TonB-dependent receptor [Candidatus Cybelea sp.]
MSSQRTLRRAVITGLLLAGFLSQGTWALAGVTGNIQGSIKESSGAPIAGVEVQAVSPSETKTATTDAGGHFVILALAPDTYTLNLTKSGYQSLAAPGVTVFADQTQSVAYIMTKTLKTIARVTSQAGAALVKSGVGSDLYSVNAAQASAAAALGGGGNLNNAYSAMASVPGVQVSQGGVGWDFNAAYVRGQNSYYTGFEYDGIPVNRSFDNYNSSTESSLGLQELQVYTGGGPAGVATSGTAGFINQVIKTGTFPGFATANLGFATPTFYHQAQVEIGGSTPDRTFSYYVGLLGYNQDYRVIDNSNGAGYMTPGNPYFSGPTLGNGIGYGFGSNQILAVGPTCLTIASCMGDKAMCPLVGAKWSAPAQGCWQYYSGLAGSPYGVSDRESVVNLHMGIPKHNGLRDDVQLLWSGSALNNYGYGTPDILGPGNNQFIYSLYGTNYHPPVCGPTTIAPGLNVNACSSPIGSAGQIVSLLPFGFVCGKSPPSAPTVGCGPTYLGYADGITYNVPFGTPISTGPGSIKPPTPYYAPNAPAHAFGGPIPLFDNSLNTNQNDAGVTKVQYTYALSQSAYLRAYGYTFYTDWYLTAPSYAGSGTNVNFFPATAQYQLITHTSGGALSFQDQLNEQNLLTLDGNYTTAGVTRYNNSTAYGAVSPIGYMSKGPHGFICYGNKFNVSTNTFGYPVPCLSSSYYDVALKSNVGPTWVAFANGGPSGFGAAGTPAAKAGATWDSLWQGNANGSFNTVRPRFWDGALQDQFRPSDKFLINAAIRYDNFTYVLPDSLTAATQFYASMTANYTCVLAATNQVFVAPLPPGAPPPAPAKYINGDCNAGVSALTGLPAHGWVHPNGTVQDGVHAPNFSATSPGSYNLNYWQPRGSATYTVNPDTVIRASAGRFVQPPISASVQYLALAGDDRSVWNNVMNLGFFSPFHPIPGISAAQYDLSWEQHLHGTDMSFKLTPFYTWVANWQQQTFIGAGFVTQVPVGVNRNEGVEFQFNKGDFSRNGLSGQLAVTYTSSKVQFQNEGLSTGGTIPNATSSLNAIISQYNTLTKAGGGSPCYQGAVGVPCSTPNKSTQDTILNPYYNKPLQGLLDPNGWYNPFSTAVAQSLNGTIDTYVSPWAGSLLLNWRKDKLAITPSINLQTGGFYGSPLDQVGIDPRTCVHNSATTGITAVSPHTNPLQCNYLTATSPGLGPFAYFNIPNPQTGSFLFANFQNPTSVFGNLQVTYDVTPRIRLSVLGVALFHTCFGGTSAPWTAAYPPGSAVCGYLPAGSNLNSSIYPSNFYNGTSFNDFAANKVHPPFTQSYTPNASNNGAIGGAVPPINLYFNATVKI